MDRITKSLLDEFSRDYSLDDFHEDKPFEHVASYVTVHRQYSETFDTSEIVLADKSMGIDAMATIINGHLITDVNSLYELAEEVSYLDVTFIFVQADRGAEFRRRQKLAISVFLSSIFSKTLLRCEEQKKSKEWAKLMAAIYDKSSKFKGATPHVASTT